MLKRMWLAVIIMTLAASSVSAQLFNGSWIGFGVHGGWTTSYNNLSVEQSIRNHLDNFSFSGGMQDIGGNLSAYSGLLGLNLDLDYAWKSRTISPGLDLRYNTLALTGTVNVMLPFIVAPYAGVGFGAFRTAQSLSNNSLTIVLPSDKTNFGWVAKAGVGANIPTLPLFPYFEWKYQNVRTPKHPITYDTLLLGVSLRI
jgi:hypothetical protein